MPNKPITLLETLKIFKSERPGFYFIIHKNKTARTKTLALLTAKQILIAYPWFDEPTKTKLLENKL